MNEYNKHNLFSPLPSRLHPYEILLCVKGDRLLHTNRLCIRDYECQVCLDVLFQTKNRLINWLYGERMRKVRDHVSRIFIYVCMYLNCTPQLCFLNVLFFLIRLCIDASPGRVQECVCVW